MAAWFQNLTWIEIGLGVVLLAIAVAPSVSAFLVKRRRRKLGNHFVGDGRHQLREVPPDDAPPGSANGDLCGSEERV